MTSLPKGIWKTLFFLLKDKPALVRFLASEESLARVENIFDREIQAQGILDSAPEKRRAFPTGRDSRWPSKREQNGWK